MDRSRPSRAVLVPLALVLLLACERDGAEPPPAPSSTAPAPTGTSTIDAPPGAYRYEGLGVAAVLTFEGQTGMLEVRNDTEIELGAPHLYLFAADDGRRIDLPTSGPEPVPPGAELTFEVAHETQAPIGMLFLMLGDDDFGAFVPVPGGGG